METLYKDITAFVREAADLDDDVEIDPHALLSGHDVDSLAGLEVVVNIERKYKIKIVPESYAQMTSVHAIAEIVNSLLEAKSAQPA
ncbi:MAG: acyl carrier protein [Nitrospira sp.]|nr:acyl carrier protein [Nitrospira sp.]